MEDPPPTDLPKPCCVCDAPGGKNCTKCKSRHYCSKACQLIDWNEGGHKAQCKKLAAAFQDRLLDSLMPLKIKEEPPIVEDVAPAGGLKVAARLSAVRAEAAALKVNAPDWRGRTCAICFDVLPLYGARRTFYNCCCKYICTDCYNKCNEYDERCPLCRTLGRDSDAEWVRRVQKHVDEGNANAQFELGDAYQNGRMGLKKSPKRAVQLFELAAAQGGPIAQCQLGQCYYLGLGVKIDHKTTALWYRRAAEQGFPDAQFNLGAMLYKGRGVAQSYDEAVKWFGLAAAQGHAQALHNLGVCHTHGHGVPQDNHEALRFFKRAAAEGHAPLAVDALRARLGQNVD